MTACSCWASRAWGSIVAMALTFITALFVPLQWTIFLGAILSLLLYVAASSHKLRLQEAVRFDDGVWEVRDAPKQLEPNRVSVIVVQGLDFFAKVPALDNQMPSARGVSRAVVVVVLRDTHRITSTAISWFERYAQQVASGGGVLMLADVNPAVMQTLTKSGALDIIGAENVFPATARVLDAENIAWNAAQKWLAEHEPKKD